MSAWFLSDQHINAMVEGAVRLGLIEPSATLKTARMLRRANVKSLNARYGDTRQSLGVDPISYKAPRKPLNDVELLKSAHCYNYQTCEYDAYDRSPARALVLRFYAALSHVDQNSKEYGAAPWGI